MRQAKATRLYSRLVHYLFTAVKWSLVVGLVSGAGLYFDVAWQLPWYRYAAGAWIFVAVASICTLFRAITIFILLMKYVAEE